MIKTIINRLKHTIYRRKNKIETEKLILSLLISAEILLAIPLITANIPAIQAFKTNSPELILPISFLIQWVAIFVPYLLIKKGFKNIKKESFCIKKQRVSDTLKDIGKGFYIFVGISILAALITIYGGVEIPGYQVQEKILAEFGTSLQSLIVAGVIMVILAPVLEEILFRGIILKKFANQFGNRWGSALAATLFAAAHMQFKNIIPLIVIGLILNHMTLRRKSITSSVIFHIINNGIAFTIELLILSGKIDIEKIIS